MCRAPTKVAAYLICSHHVLFEQVQIRVMLAYIWPKNDLNQSLWDRRETLMIISLENLHFCDMGFLWRRSRGSFQWNLEIGLDIRCHGQAAYRMAQPRLNNSFLVLRPPSLPKRTFKAQLEFLQPIKFRKCSLSILCRRSKIVKQIF